MPRSSAQPPRPPRFVDVGYSRLEVQLSPDLHPPDDYGDYRHPVIRVAAELTPADQVDTLLHELVHAAIDARSLPLETDAEERVAEAVANYLAEALLRNPPLAKYLYEVAKRHGKEGRR